MKKILASSALVILALSAFAQASTSIVRLTDVQAQSLALATIAPLDVINWKVGDSANFDVKAGAFGKLGTMNKSVTKDEGAALWITSNMDLMIQKQKIEMLLNKADGKVLKTIVNGKEQAPSDDEIEIISQDYVDVTVPAGTFKAIHIVAKSKQASHIEVWANPRDTVMEGTLKQAITAQGMDIVMELTAFKRN